MVMEPNPPPSKREVFREGVSPKPERTVKPPPPPPPPKKEDPKK